MGLCKDRDVSQHEFIKEVAARQEQTQVRWGHPMTSQGSPRLKENKAREI